MKSTNLLIRVTPDEKKILNAIAEKQGLTLSELLRTAPLPPRRTSRRKRKIKLIARNKKRLRVIT